MKNKRSILLTIFSLGLIVAAALYFAPVLFKPLTIATFSDPILNEELPPAKNNWITAFQLGKMKKKLNEFEDGVGISANQVGLKKRIFVFDRQGELTGAINPEILHFDEETVFSAEGCASDNQEGRGALVNRSPKVKVRYQKTDGKIIEEELVGLTAAVFQHELDHLNGHTILEKAIVTWDAGSITDTIETIKKLSLKEHPKYPGFFYRFNATNSK